MSSLIPHDYRYKISSPTPVDKEPKKNTRYQRVLYIRHALIVLNSYGLDLLSHHDLMRSRL